MPQTFRVQRIRSCSQCGERLSSKCDKCKAHPDRKPRIIEIFDFPEILATAECGCCVKIKCQRDGCAATFWRYVKLHFKEKKSPSKTFMCSQNCAALYANSLKAKKIIVSCSYCGLNKEVWPSKLKASRDIFCNPSHHYLWMRRRTHERQQSIEAAESLVQSLWCPECKDIQNCMPKSKYTIHNSNTFTCPKEHTFNIREAMQDHLYKPVASSVRKTPHHQMAEIA